MKKEIRIVLISAVIGLIVGWFSHIGFNSYENYYNRPILSLKILSLTVNEIQKDNWEMQIVVNQKNTGNSKAIYNIKECKIAFPLVQEETIRIEYNKSLSLSQRTAKYDTLNIPIPKSFGKIDIEQFYSFHFIELLVDELRTEKKYVFKRDSSELVLKGKLFAEKKKIPTVKDFITINSETGDSILIGGIHSFFYNDKFYKNHFLPSDAKVSHKIKDDMILIEFLTEENKPFLYIPHEELKDKILLPNTVILSGSIEQNTEIGKKYINFELTKESEYGDIYFFLFKE